MAEFFKALFHWNPPSHCVGIHSWEWCTGGNIPEDAVHGGTDADGGDIYVGRAMHMGDLLPAKVCPHHGCAFVSWNGEEIRIYAYEVLKSTHAAWKEAYGGDIPSEAIRVGQTAHGEFLFVGRTFHEGTLTVGKVHPSHGVLYIPFGGREISYRKYEILVLC
uniref:Uncharacterized protein n=1 Tax=Riptortus pedestris TaxID=329032 RepID=R4WIJ6_RIPPE|nr:conserved hypothetical protein [Riptortus pedestris]